VRGGVPAVAAPIAGAATAACPPLAGDDGEEGPSPSDEVPAGSE
jgi:hypothetical protein